MYALIDPITNMIRYVGQTTRPKKRFWLYRRSARAAEVEVHNEHLDRWLKRLHRCGQGHEVEILESGFTSREDLDEAERFWVDYLRSIGCPLINLRDGGASSRFTEEAKQKVRRAMAHPDVRAALSASASGRVVSVETRAKMSASRKGKKHTDETRAKMSAAQSGEKNAMYGKRASDETRAKLSAAHRGKQRSFSAETRAKMSAARKAFFAENPSAHPSRRADVRTKISKAKRRWWAELKSKS